MKSPYSERQLRAFAEWLNEPLTPGIERKLNLWLSENMVNQDTWDRWGRINGRAKRLQVVPGDVNADWVTLKDELGFVRSGKRKKRNHSLSRQRDFFRQPAAVAVISMIVFSLFLYFLHLLRIKVGF